MKLKPSIFGPKWGKRIANVGLQVAKLAGYDAARPTITRESHTRYNTNPNTSMSQVERVQMQWNAEYLAKNSAFAIGYLSVRRNYCSPQSWLPNTGDKVLNGEVKDYFNEQAKNMGINCSLWTAFSRSGDSELPIRGDSGLLWYRDENRLRLIEFSSDQIGELYTFVQPYTNIAGLTYFAGMYFDQHGQRVAMKIYERGNTQVYTNPQIFPASDIIYFQDNIFRAVRGISKFSGSIVALEKSGKLLQFGLDAAQKQAKTGVVMRNNSGSPLGELDYETRVLPDGNVVYIEQSFDGAQTQYQYNGDGYEVIQTTAPGEYLINGCRYADEQAALSLAMPYAFLVNAAEVGGAPYRGELGKAGKEIGRITRLHTENFSKIPYVVMMDAVERGIFKGAALKFDLTAGEPFYPNLPTSDSFNDSKDDVMSMRYCLDSPKRILARYRENEDDIIQEKADFAVKIAMAVEDSNKQLVAAGYKPTITQIDIGQTSENPQQSAEGELLESGKPVPTNGPTPTGG